MKYDGRDCHTLAPYRRITIARLHLIACKRWQSIKPSLVFQVRKRLHASHQHHTGIAHFRDKGCAKLCSYANDIINIINIVSIMITWMKLRKLFLTICGQLLKFTSKDQQTIDFNVDLINCSWPTCLDLHQLSTMSRHVMYAYLDFNGLSSKSQKKVDFISNVHMVHAHITVPSWHVRLGTNKPHTLTKYTPWD